MNSGEMIIRPIEADDARAVLRLVRQDFARVGQAADIEGLGYEEPTDEDIASLEAAVTDPKQPYQRAGAFDTDDHLVTYAKYGRLHPKDVVPYFGTCAALALASKG